MSQLVEGMPSTRVPCFLAAPAASASYTYSAGDARYLPVRQEHRINARQITLIVFTRMDERDLAEGGSISNVV